MDKLENLLKNVVDTYWDFVHYVMIIAKENPERVNEIIDFLESNPELPTSDVLEWVDKEIEGIDLDNPVSIVEE